MAFVTDPELVLRASVDARQGDRAEIVEYILGNDETSQPLAGKMTLRATRPGARETGDMLSMELREPRRFLAGSCALTSYSGMFLGVLQPPSETQAAVGTFIAPGR